jgi:hypothetical protein
MKTILYEAFSVVNIRIAVFWGVMPCSLVDSYRSFVGICICPEDVRLKRYKNTWCDIPQNGSLKTKSFSQYLILLAAGSSQRSC